MGSCFKVGKKKNSYTVTQIEDYVAVSGKYNTQTELKASRVSHDVKVKAAYGSSSPVKNGSSKTTTTSTTTVVQRAEVRPRQEDKPVVVAAAAAHRKSAGSSSPASSTHSREIRRDYEFPDAPRKEPGLSVPSLVVTAASMGEPSPDAHQMDTFFHKSKEASDTDSGGKASTASLHDHSEDEREMFTDWRPAVALQEEQRVFAEPVIIRSESPDLEIVRSESPDLEIVRSEIARPEYPDLEIARSESPVIEVVRSQSPVFGAIRSDSPVYLGSGRKSSTDSSGRQSPDSLRDELLANIDRDKYVIEEHARTVITVNTDHSPDHNPPSYIPARDTDSPVLAAHSPVGSAHSPRSSTHSEHLSGFHDHERYHDDVQMTDSPAGTWDARLNREVSAELDEVKRSLASSKASSVASLTEKSADDAMYRYDGNEQTAGVTVVTVTTTTVTTEGSTDHHSFHGDMDDVMDKRSSSDEEEIRENADLY